jgi:hypothetical protein
MSDNGNGNADKPSEPQVTRIRESEFSKRGTEIFVSPPEAKEPTTVTAIPQSLLGTPAPRAASEPPSSPAEASET